MDKLSLICHPDTPCTAHIAIEVEVARTQGGRLSLRYVVTGETQGIFWPAAVLPERADGLWQTTCFEAFLRKRGEAGYTELNFSPSGQWAAYEFTAPRTGMRAADIVPQSRFDIADGDARLSISTLLRGPDADAALEMNITAVIEARDGTKSFWALRHPPAKPDFHDPDCFAFNLKAGETA